MKRALLCLAVGVMGFSQALAQFDADKIDEVAERAMDVFNTPGMSIAIVHKQELIYSKGFGQANIEQSTNVEPETYFRLASTSKAFTAAALAILVDEGKLKWDDLVIDYLPDFRLKDSYATANFTIEDLLTHKSGLVSGAGDSMIWPEPSGFSRDEVVHNLKYLTPDYDFREQYAYSNVMYITAGEVVEAVTQQRFEDFVDQRIFKALQMNCFAGDMPKKALEQSAMAYGYNDERGIYPIPRNAIDGKPLMSAAAGGMVCNASDMAKWLNALLTVDPLPFSKTQLNKMWQAHTILSVSDTDTEWDGTHFRTYGLGWRLANYGPYKHISHTGTLSGYQAYVALIPELELGAVVLNNGSNYGARGAVMQSILKMFVDIDKEQADWIKAYQDYQDEREQAYLARLETPKALAKPSIDEQSIIGEYKDAWYGSLIISKSSSASDDGALRIHSTRMKSLTGKLRPFQDTSFKIVWDNQNAANDAFMHFDLDVKRNIIGAKLHPFSVNMSSRHEWRDMYFQRVE
uniref:serine hydrolase n=1 Tax=Ningiella ruwaisensis TaxID=2364274 RepID=UPI0010A0645E|nr:serine hydrolase [Ningiella ruwaisensis]